MSAQIEPGPLGVVLRDAAAGRFPPPDNEVTVLPSPSPRDSGVIGFTAHAVVFTDADPAWVRARLPDDDPSRPLSPAFLQALCAHTHREAHTIDLLCVAWPRSGPPGMVLSPEPDVAHPRIARAMRYRDDVRAWRTEGGVVLVGHGSPPAGRWPSRSTPAIAGTASAVPWPPRPATWCPPADRSGRRSRRLMRPASARFWRPVSGQSAPKPS